MSTSWTRLGRFEVAIVSGGAMRIDGGAMFGVVPRVMWEPKIAPDEHNRIPMDNVILVLRGGGATILVDSGYGSTPSARDRSFLGLEEGHPLVRNLESAGVRPEDVDLLILTHLHFDHVGGCTQRDAAGRASLVFPNARHVAQRAEWEDATGEKPELANAYTPRDLHPIQQSGALELIDGETEVFLGVKVVPVGGHTRGHQVVVVGRGADRIVCLADMCPTRHHVRPYWTLAYDQFPLEARRVKPIVLRQIADAGAIAVFGHETTLPAARLKIAADGQIQIAEAVALTQPGRPVSAA